MAVISRFIILLFVGVGVSGAVNAEFGTDAPSQAASTKPLVVKSLPMPGQLTPGWWSYFDVEGDTFSERLKETQSRLAGYVERLPDELRDEAQQHLERFMTNLSALPNLRKIGKAATPEPPVYQNSYSIAEWLDAARKQRAGEAEYNDFAVRFQRESNALKAAQKVLNTMMAAYLDMGATDSGRLLRGLELMAERSALAVGEHQSRVRKSALEAEQIHLAHLTDQFKAATERLKADSQDLTALEEAISTRQDELDKAQKALRRAHAQALGAIGQNAVSLMEARAREQNVVNAALGEALASLQLASARSERDLTILLLDADTRQTEATRKRLARWQDLRQNLKEQASTWEQTTQQELNQVQARIAALNADERNSKLHNVLKQRLQLAQEALLRLKQLTGVGTDLDILIKEIDQRITLREGGLSRLFNWSSKQAQDFKNEVLAWWMAPLFSIGETPITAAGLLRVAIILVIAVLISSLLRRGLNRLARRGNGSNASALYTVGRLAHYVILLLGLIIALSSIGLDFTNLALVAGALSVGIGFGLQSIVNNFVSGLILLFERSLKVGDFIELESGITGTVTEINVRSTLVNTNDNVDIIVPNSALVGGKVINWTLREANRRIRVPFGVAYGSDKELVRKAALEAASRVPYTHKPRRRSEAAQCWLVGFGDSSLDFELVVWVNQEAVNKPDSVNAAYMWEIETSLRDYAIEIPFPQRDLHLRSVFGDTQRTDLSKLIDQRGKSSR